MKGLDVGVDEDGSEGAGKEVNWKRATCDANRLQGLDDESEERNRRMTTRRMTKMEAWWDDKLPESLKRG